LFESDTETDEYGFFVELVRWQISTFVEGAASGVVVVVGVVVVLVVVVVVAAGVVVVAGAVVVVVAWVVVAGGVAPDACPESPVLAATKPSNAATRARQLHWTLVWLKT
jgi:hypothetical protein